MQHSRLILFNRDDIVAAAVDDLFTEIPLAKHGVAGDDLALQGQHAQKLQRRFVFVGLGADAELGDHGADARGVGGQQMNAGHLIAGAAAQGLAVQGDDVAPVGTALSKPLA